MNARWLTRWLAPLTVATAAGSAATLATAMIEPAWAMWPAGGTVLCGVGTLAANGAQRRRIRTALRWSEAIEETGAEHQIEPNGDDAFAEMGNYMRSAQRRMRRNAQIELIQTLTGAVESKNDALERALEQLKTTQDAAISNQKLAELGQLTAGVAHEIRNPLHFISNYAEASAEMGEDLLAACSGDDGEARTVRSLADGMRSNMGKISEHADRANRIIQDMLAMGRNTPAETEITNATQLLETHRTLAYQAYRAQHPDKQVRLPEIAVDGDCDVECRPQEIGRVIVNLVTNACQAAGQADARAEPGVVETGIESTVESVSIWVSDNGDGIRDEIKERIFTPFFTTKGQDGTGLGLAICHDIVRAHQGEITVADRDGGGTIVRVTLPTNRIEGTGEKAAV